jgi:hypothetical protein
MQSSDGSTGICRLPWLGAVFEAAGSQGEIARAVVLDKGVLPSPEIPGIRLKADFHELLELVDGQVCVDGRLESETTLQVTHEGHTVDLKFAIRSLGDEFAYGATCKTSENNVRIGTQIGSSPC